MRPGGAQHLLQRAAEDDDLGVEDVDDVGGAAAQPAGDVLQGRRPRPASPASGRGDDLAHAGEPAPGGPGGQLEQALLAALGLPAAARPAVAGQAAGVDDEVADLARVAGPAAERTAAGDDARPRCRSGRTGRPRRRRRPPRRGRARPGCRGRRRCRRPPAGPARRPARRRAGRPASPGSGPAGPARRAAAPCPARRRRRRRRRSRPVSASSSAAIFAMAAITVAGCGSPRR